MHPLLQGLALAAPFIMYAYGYFRGHHSGERSARKQLEPQISLLERRVALVRLGHDDPETNLAGWSFRFVKGHIHAIPPEGGLGYFGISMDYDPNTGRCAERVKIWTRPDGRSISRDREMQITRAYWSWFRQQVIAGRRSV